MKGIKVGSESGSGYDYRLFNEQTYQEDPEPLHSSINNSDANRKKVNRRRLKIASGVTLVGLALVAAIVLTAVFVSRSSSEPPGEAIDRVVTNVLVKDESTGETVAQLNATTLGEELWQPLSQAFGLSQLVIKNLNITQVVDNSNSSTVATKTSTTNRVREATQRGILISKDTNKVIISGSVSNMLGMLDARVTLVIMIPALSPSASSEQQQQLVPQLVLQIFTTLDWKPSDIPFFRVSQQQANNNTQSSWITGLRFRASGSLVVSSTSFAQFTFVDAGGLNATTTTTTTTALVRGLNLFFHNASLSVESDSSSTLSDALESIPLGDISIRDLDIDFSATIENTNPDSNVINGGKDNMKTTTRHKQSTLTLLKQQICSRLFSRRVSCSALKSSSVAQRSRPLTLAFNWTCFKTDSRRHHN